MQARVNVKMCLSMIVGVHTNSPPSYVSSLVTPCSSLQPRGALRSSYQADFFVTRSLNKMLKPCICICCTRLDVSGCRTSFTKLHHYRFVKLTSTHSLLVQNLLGLNFLMLRALCKMLLFRHAINDSLITIIIKILKMHVINSGATTIGLNFKRCS